MIWILGSSLIMIIAWVVCFATDRWTDNHSSSNRRLYNFISSIWEKSIHVSCISTLVFAGVMIVFIFSRIGIDCMVYNVKVKHDTLIYEYEMLNSDCEDISKIEVIDKIKDWNKSVYWERYWADNIWTNWFHPKKITEAYEYIELD